MVSQGHVHRGMRLCNRWDLEIRVMCGGATNGQ